MRAAPPPDDQIDTADDLRPVAARIAAPVLIADRYELGKLLGEGGMGEVHECRDRVIERSVALKTIRRDQSKRQLEGRLAREACVQAQLEHPAIVPVYEIARTAEGTTFFTMRKLAGVSLEEELGRARAGKTYQRHRLLAAFSEVCLAVHYAHSRGVLHRDLKPSNIMLGDFGEVYVLDWGLAKLQPGEIEADASAVAPGDRRMTAFGTTLGTPAYMAPEQIGDHELDARTDVFALGAVLFELLTLEPLLDQTAIDARLKLEPATWDARATVRAPHRDVPPELERICVRATAPEREDRYASARELHDAIEAYLDGERDVGLRAKLAAAHLARAEAARASDPDDALREVNRALALAPDEPRAMQLLVDLLDSPSAQERARAEVEAAGIARYQGSQPFGLLFTIPWLTAYPIYLLLRGARSIPLALVPIVLWLVATIATVVARRRPSTTHAWYPVFFFMLATATGGAIAGPLFLVPSFATSALGTHMLVQPRALRAPTYVLGAMAVLLPMVLVWLGVYTPYTFIEEGQFSMRGITRELHADNLGLFFTLTDTAFVVGVATFALRFRRAIDGARTAKIVTAWQLSKLLSPNVTKDPPTRQAPEPAAVPAPTPLRPLDQTTFTREGARYADGEVITADAATVLERVRDRYIGRDVAMKRSRGDAPRDVHQEALFQATVEHPAVPTIYDVGSDERGPWFTMKLVRGKPLSEILRSEAKPGRHERLSTFARVCLAVDFAHSRGVLHTALHPDNVVLGEFGEAYVLGWSHAKRQVHETDVQASGPLAQTRPLAALAYLAPEQGVGGKVDERTDVYALGVLLCAVVTGSPSASNELPPALAAICRRATAAAPEDRYSTSRELHDAVEAFLSADRDEELRRELAADRLETAKRRAERALESGSVTRRIEALRALGRALALAPDRSEGLRLLRRLLDSPPARLPPEAEREIEEQIWEAARPIGRISGVAYAIGGVAGYALYALVVGVREWPKLIAILVAWAIAAVIVSVQTRTPRTRLEAVPWAAFASFVAMMASSLMLGPWLVVPSLIITTAMAWVLIVPSRWQYPIIAFGAASVIAPAIPVLLGVSDVVEMHGIVEPLITIHGAARHPPLAFLTVLPLANAASVLLAGLYAARYRDLLDGLEAENRARVHALSRLM